jgi:hypothetical protein
MVVSDNPDIRSGRTFFTLTLSVTTNLPMIGTRSGNASRRSNGANKARPEVLSLFGTTWLGQRWTSVPRYFFHLPVISALVTASDMNAPLIAKPGNMLVR